MQEKLSNGVWFPTSLLISVLSGCYLLFEMLHIAVFGITFSQWFFPNIFIVGITLVLGLSGVLSHIEVSISDEDIYLDRLTKVFLDVSDNIWNWLTYIFISIFLITLMMLLITGSGLTNYQLGVLSVSFMLGGSMFTANQLSKE